MRKLGKGLAALIETDKSDSKKIILIDCKTIKFNPYQPRTKIDSQKIQELAKSISENGLIQPIIVRKIAENQYELIAGQRRLSAAQLAGYEKVPAIIRSAKNQEILEFSIIENIQREDLNPLDEARAYERLAKEFKMTHYEIAKSVGKNRTTISNLLRLLKLPQKAKEMILENKITSGHARAILKVAPKSQIEFAEYISKNSISVRKAEELATSFGKVEKRIKQKKKDENIIAVENQLTKIFGTKIKIVGMKKGKLEIHFYSAEELNNLVNKLINIL